MEKIGFGSVESLQRFFKLGETNSNVTTELSVNMEKVVTNLLLIFQGDSNYYIF